MQMYRSYNADKKKKRRKTKIDDGFYPELVVGSKLEGYMGIPMLMNLKNTCIPNKIIPFDRIETELHKGNTRGYVGFYLLDEKFTQIITDIDDYVEILKHFDGVITPDCTLLSGQANCLQATNTYFNRAVGFYLQKQGIPVIPQIRWSDASSYEYCFLGVPKNNIVAVSTYGCIRSSESKDRFKKGFDKMLDVLEPSDVVLYGSKPPVVFNEFEERVRIYHFQNWISVQHQIKDGGYIGMR